ncbi:MAG: LCP family protein [Acidimicrobiales bacterium]
MDATGQPETTDPPLDRRSLQAARRKARRGRRRWARRAGIVLGVLVLVTAGFAGAGWFHGRDPYDQIRKVHATDLVAEPPPGRPFDILLVGFDSRAFVDNSTEAKASRTRAQAGQRSDVTMVARIVPATRQVYVLSLPGDLWVDIPGNVSGISGMNRIDAAVDSGPDLLIETIEHDLGIPVNHYAAVDVAGFQGMVDALGGITMSFPDPVKDASSGLDVTQTGCQTVDGAEALALVRSRHLYYEQHGAWQYGGPSDVSRIQRQDAFFRAVLAKADASLSDPLAMNAFIGAAVKNLTIDDTMSEGDLLRLATIFRRLPAADLHTETLPTYAFTTAGGADVLGEAQPYAERMITRFDALGSTPLSATPSRGSSPSSTTTVPSVPPSAVTVQVLNGSGVTGQAGQAEVALRAAGFAVGTAGDAADYGFTRSVVQYAPGHVAAAHALAGYVGGAVTLTADAQLQGDDLVLTTGSDFTGVTGGTRAGDVVTNTRPEPWNPTTCTA